MKKKKLLCEKSLKAVLLLAILSICVNTWAQDEPIYYRIGWYGDNIDYDDTPRTFEFSRATNTYQKLFENFGENKQDTIGNRLSFLGTNNSFMPDESISYAFYVDTAYINRGTGWVKPQYMLAVDTFMVDHYNSLNWWGGSRYVIGRYLYNASMYAKSVEGSARTNFNKVQSVDHTKTRNPNGNAYIQGTGFERLAFSWAIHKGDSLYVLKGANLEPHYKGVDDDPYRLWLTLSKEYGEEGMYIDFNKLISENIIPGSEYQDGARTYYDFKPATALSPGKTIGLHAVIALDDNTHKDWVFSFRLVPKVDGLVSFAIESETTNRDVINGEFIRPEFGGWVGYQNNVPVILHTDINNMMADMNTYPFTISATNSPSVSNKVIADDTSTKISVIGGTGNITILNAANKKVIISDILGRTVANIRASSDNISVVAPSGIIIVAIEGEKAVKVIVK